MRKGFKWLAAPALALAFLYAVLSIVMTPLESGDAYPQYSTLRADPLGAKILYESLAELPDLQVERNFRMLGLLPGTQPGTLFQLGGSGPAFSAESEGQLKQYEMLASAGWRVVFVFQNAKPRMKANFDVFEKRRAAEKGAPRVPPLVSRWGIRLHLREASTEEVSDAGSNPLTSALYFEGDQSWLVTEEQDDGRASQVEKKMGRGTVVLRSEIYPLSNEGLREEKQGDLVASLIGSGTVRIVFDEQHLGISQSGSVGSLIRRYGLQGATGLLLLAGLLFIWRNATSLLPMRPTSVAQEFVTGRDSQQGMVSLLRRSIPEDQLMAVCAAEWERARPLLGSHRAQQIAVVEGESPVAAYRRIREGLTKRK